MHKQPTPAGTAEARTLYRRAALPGWARAGGSREADSWPRTSRLLPWAIAGFLCIVVLVPFDAITLPLTLPVDSKLDRFALGGLAILWFGTLVVSRLRGWRSPTGISPTLIDWALWGFLAAATASLLVNAESLALTQELEVATKKLSVVVSLVAFYYIVSTGVKVSEVRAFMTLVLVLGCVTALGTIVEYRTGVNWFFDLASDTWGSFARVSPEPPDPPYARPSITGPTSHGLALTSLLALLMPIALIRALHSKDSLRRWLYIAVLALLLAGAVSTLRKTALVAPAVGLITAVCLQPRLALRSIPLIAVLVVSVQLISPGALSGIRYELTGGSEQSNEGRTSDYDAVRPDLATSPILGRGIGSYDPLLYQLQAQYERHRILDNQFLMLAIETGVLGVGAYVFLMVAAFRVPARARRDRDAARAGPAVAAAAAAAVFAVSNLTYDVLAFPQVPYLFLGLIGLGAVAARGTTVSMVSRVPRGAGDPVARQQRTKTAVAADTG